MTLAQRRFARIWARVRSETRPLLKTRSDRLLAGACLALAAYLILTASPRLTKDSYSYIDGDIFRTALYPTILAGSRAAFGLSLGLRVVTTAQTLFVLTSAVFLAGWLRTALNLPARIFWIGVAILGMVPLTVFDIGRLILTEGIAYGFFLLAVLKLGQVLSSSGNRGWTHFCLLAGLAVLTRPQFVFLWPIGIVVASWSGVRAGSRSVALRLLVALAVTCLSVSALDRAYRAVRFGLPASVPFVGAQLMVGALYVSSKHDVELFTDREADYFAQIRARAKILGMLQEDNPWGRTRWLFAGEHYRQSYDILSWRTVIQGFLQDYLDRPYGVFDKDETRVVVHNPQDFIEMNRVLVPMALRILVDHPVATARWYLRNLVGNLQPSGYGVYIFAVLVAAVGLCARRAWRGDPRAVAFGSFALLHVANVALICWFEPLLWRYIFYTAAPLAFGLVLNLDPDSQSTARCQAVYTD